MKELVLLLFILCSHFLLKAQTANCEFKQPVVTINFGSGDQEDVTDPLADYQRVRSYCPTDGHYTITDYTGDCFRGDWLTLDEDHTPGDAAGNMMIVNSSYNPGVFFTTTVNGLKSNTTYEFSLWLMNVCRISEKCPFPLLPNLTIQLLTKTGKTVAQFGTGEVARRAAPHWTPYRAIFATGPETSLTIVMTNNKHGGCGNDFALDDISFRECVKTPPAARTTSKKPSETKRQTASAKPPPKKTTAVKKQPPPQTAKAQKDSQKTTTPVLKWKPTDFPPPPSVLRTRTNSLVKHLETEAGEIRIDLYDNGEIDGDSVSIYHNNELHVKHARLSQKPVTIRIGIDRNSPHHEVIMVAENLGSIPPNTSLMIITAGDKRYQVFISSTEQKNAKVIFDLKQ